MGDDELTVNQIIERLKNEGKLARNVTRNQVSVLISKNKSFEKAKGPNNNGSTKLRHATVWRNRNVMD